MNDTAQEMINELESAIDRGAANADILRKNIEFIRDNRSHMSWLDELVDNMYCCEDCSPFWQSLQSRAHYDDFIAFCKEEIESRRAD